MIKSRYFIFSMIMIMLFIPIIYSLETTVSDNTISDEDIIDIRTIPRMDYAYLGIENYFTQSNHFSTLCLGSPQICINQWNLSEMNISFNETDPIAIPLLNSLNSSKVDTFTCPSGYAVQNGSAHSVQCILMPSGTSFITDQDNNNLNKSANITFNSINVAGNGSFSSGINPTQIGAGKRLQYKSGAVSALRIGYSYDEWDGYQGSGSFADGNRNTASGDYSAALGDSVISSGYASLATGVAAIASGESALASGFLTTGSGIGSFVGGFSANSDATKLRAGTAIASTESNLASIAPFAFGYATLGNTLKAEGNGSVAMGQDVNALTNNNIIIFGKNGSTSEAKSFNVAFDGIKFKVNSTGSYANDSQVCTANNGICAAGNTGFNSTSGGMIINDTATDITIDMAVFNNSVEARGQTNQWTTNASALLYTNASIGNFSAYNSTYNCPTGQVLMNATANKTGIFGQCVAVSVDLSNYVLKGSGNLTTSDWSNITGKPMIGNLSNNSDASLVNVNITGQLYLDTVKNCTKNGVLQTYANGSVFCNSTGFNSTSQLDNRYVRNNSDENYNLFAKNISTKNITITNNGQISMLSGKIDMGLVPGDMVMQYDNGAGYLKVTGTGTFYTNNGYANDGVVGGDISMSWQQADYNWCSATVSGGIMGDIVCDGCFLANTSVTMSDGSHKNIQDIHIGEYVMSYNFTSNTTVASKVIQTYQDTNRVYYTIYFSDDTAINVTPNHPFYTTNGWKSIIPQQTETVNLTVRKLQINDSVKTEVGWKNITGMIRVKVKARDEFDIYNLNYVENTHIFFANGALVHNKCFTGNSIIQTSEGKKKASDIKLGDFVLNDKGEYSEVITLYEKESLLPLDGKILLNGNIVTNNHLIHGIEAGKLNLPDIKINSKVYDLKLKDGVTDVMALVHA